jgi:hypothetical protein
MLNKFNIKTKELYVTTQIEKKLQRVSSSSPKTHQNGRKVLISHAENTNSTCLSLFPTIARPKKRVTCTASTLEYGSRA